LDNADGSRLLAEAISAGLLQVLGEFRLQDDHQRHRKAYPQPIYYVKPAGAQFVPTAPRTG
jgi:hypothetical protein